eukprot:CAMPEP_0171233142 /NCGR_PEP_ID=MMETSP0790-20130122/40767_1 /TAXON_ID=2925 /ORGANISM="Alexandrium catenella, Strain OF101" /LENGTH=59 /DNA_ID=CAMNT_0011699391 /DNA_START=53 /DNA_END=229 /DNA_ORIENTATION=+
MVQATHQLSVRSKEKNIIRDGRAVHQRPRATAMLSCLVAVSRNRAAQKHFRWTMVGPDS